MHRRLKLSSTDGFALSQAMFETLLTSKFADPYMGQVVERGGQVTKRTYCVGDVRLDVDYNDNGHNSMIVSGKDQGKIGALIKKLEELEGINLIDA